MMRKAYAALVVLLISAAGLVFPGSTQAEPPTMSFVIIDEIHLYQKEGSTERSSVTLSPYQNVLLAPDAPFSFYDERKPEEWLKIQTWLGEKWIRDDEKVLYGSYQEQQTKLTLLAAGQLFDQPDRKTDTGQSLAPQEVQATAVIRYGPKYVVNAMSAAGQSGTWYRIQTSWMGEKWIQKPVIMEDVHPVTVQYDLKLTGAETAFLVPYSEEGKGEPIEPGIVHVTAKWEDRSIPFNAHIWYKVKLPQGERWISPKQEVLEDYHELNGTVTLPTRARYFDSRIDSYDSTQWLEPGTYPTIQAVNDWTQLQTPYGLKWVNLKRALLERPEGIVPTDEIVKLTAETQTYYYPLTGQVMHIQGFFAPQEVPAFEKWTSPEGAVWYHIGTFSGSEWVHVNGK
jgi:hypothetical protein